MIWSDCVYPHAHKVNAKLCYSAGVVMENNDSDLCIFGAGLTRTYELSSCVCVCVFGQSAWICAKTLRNLQTRETCVCSVCISVRVHCACGGHNRFQAAQTEFAKFQTSPRMDFACIIWYVTGSPHIRTHAYAHHRKKNRRKVPIHPIFDVPDREI